MKIFATIASSLLLMLVLTACGSDSGPTPNTTVSGIASKGPIINGVVKIYSIKDGVITFIKQTTTDANGSTSPFSQPFSLPR